MKTRKPELTRFDIRLFSLKRLIDKYRGWLVSLAGGFVAGWLTTTIADPSVKDFIDLYNRFFNIEHQSLNILSWLALTILIVLPIVQRLLTKHYMTHRYESLLVELMNESVESVATPFARGKIAWGSAISITVCPDLHEGWQLGETRIRLDNRIFEMPREKEQDYREFFNDNYETKRLFDDRKKYMLTETPTTLIDSPSLVLDVQESRYSQCLYYQNHVAGLKAEREAYIEELFSKGVINFPHNFCMHAVVITRDNFVLAIKRRHDLEYYEDRWSVSVEEQLANEDLRHDESERVLQWARRLLYEELGVNREHYNDKNLRLLSVFLETEILNCSVCCVCRLAISKDFLNDLIKTKQVKPKTDLEFDDWKFFTLTDVVSQIAHPELRYHPTSSYRMLMASIHYFGLPRLAQDLFSSY